MKSDVSVVVAWHARKAKPLANIIFDAEPCFDLSLFDYSGSMTEGQTMLLSGQQWTYSPRIHSFSTEGKGDILRRIADDSGATSYDYIGIIDDDILARVSDLNKAIRIGTRENLASFQPSLAKCSYYSHSFTLQHPGSILRRVAWTEIMMPFIKRDLFRGARLFCEHSISSWGLDCYAFPMIALINNIGTYHAVIDASIAAHIRPITSGNRVYRNGLTAHQEMTRLKTTCQAYLANRGIDWKQDNQLRELFQFE